MSNATLERRIRAVERRVTPVREARAWLTCLEDGEALSAELQAQIGERDTLTIRLYPRGWLVDVEYEQSMCYQEKGPRGHMISHVVRQGEVNGHS